MTAEPQLAQVPRRRKTTHTRHWNRQEIHFRLTGFSSNDWFSTIDACMLRKAVLVAPARIGTRPAP
jgi:hypothetical protein